MNYRAWDIVIQVNGIYELSVAEIRRVIELEDEGFYVHYVTQDEFEYFEEHLHRIMRFVDRKLFYANMRGRNFIPLAELHNNLYISKPGMKAYVEMFFGVR